MNRTMFKIEGLNNSDYNAWTTNDLGLACKELSEVRNVSVTILPRAGEKTLDGAPLVEAEIRWVCQPDHGCNYLTTLVFDQARQEYGPISKKEFWRFYEDHCDNLQQSWPVAEED